MFETQGNVAYDLSLFAEETEQEKQEQQEELVVAPKKSKKPKLKSLKERKQEAKIVAFKTTRVVIITALLLVCVGVLTLARTQLAESTAELAAAEKSYALAQSENTKLGLELSAIASIDKVEVYARDVLGMIKQEKSQVEYLDLSEGNKVVFSNSEKSGNVLEQIDEKIKSFWEYIS